MAWNKSPGEKYGRVEADAAVMVREDAPRSGDKEEPPPPPGAPGYDVAKTTSSRKKKLALAAVGVAVVALGLVLGLGLGLKSGAASHGASAFDATVALGVDAGTTEESASSEDENYGYYSGSVDADDEEEVETFDAIIIGAGWAGLRALDTLLERGVTSSMVLEAYDKVGGRCRSENSDGSRNNPDLDEDVIPYDLGAEFSYDSGINDQQNVLWDMDIIPGRVWEVDKFAVWPTWPGWATYYQQERRDDGRLRTAKIENGLGQGLDGDGMLNYVWETFVRYRTNNLEELKGKSYGEAIDQYIEEDQWTDDEALQFINLIEDAKHIEYGTGDYEMDITHIEFMDPSFHVETSYMGVPGVGWGNVAAKYGARFRERIRTKSQVVGIDSLAGQDYVVVTYRDRRGAVRKMRGKTVVMTASVGVLKAGTIEFTPPLPATKQAAIDAFGFGVINKCIMSWDDPADRVWPEDERWFLLATPDDETSGRWTTFSNPSGFKGVPSLTGWIGGPDAVRMEGQSDDEIVEEVMANLRAMFPDIKRPDDVIVTRWGQENHVRGAYAFPLPGQDFYKDVEALRQTIGRVYFAGEATTARGWATTFGAWASGEEAGKQIAYRLSAEDGGAGANPEGQR